MSPSVISNLDYSELRSASVMPSAITWSRSHIQYRMISVLEPIDMVGLLVDRC